jgi:hypothetical protein
MTAETQDCCLKGRGIFPDCSCAGIDHRSTLSAAVRLQVVLFQSQTAIRKFVILYHEFHKSTSNAPTLQFDIKQQHSSKSIVGLVKI